MSLGGPGLLLSVLGVRVCPPRVLAVSALPLDFCGKVRLLKTMHVPAT